MPIKALKSYLDPLGTCLEWLRSGPTPRILTLLGLSNSSISETTENFTAFWNMLDPMKFLGFLNVEKETLSTTKTPKHTC